MQRIDNDWNDIDKTRDTVKNFLKLFIINQGALDTISNDEWSRKINQAVIRSNHMDRIKNGEKMNVNE